jgi:hypothetical protein
VPDSQKQSWLIQGYDGLTPIFRRKLSSALSVKEVSALLQRLAARDLSVSEVINASLRRSMRSHNAALQVRREHRNRTTLACGENPHYVASLHTEYELRDPHMEGVA